MGDFNTLLKLTSKYATKTLFCLAPSETCSSIRPGKSNALGVALNLATNTRRLVTVVGMTWNNLVNVIR